MVPLALVADWSLSLRQRVGGLAGLLLAAGLSAGCPHRPQAPPAPEPSGPASAVVLVTVTDDRGDPLAGALVRLDGIGSLTTDTGGLVAWRDVPSGARHLFVEAVGYRATDWHVDLVAGQEHRYDARLVRQWAQRRGLVRIDHRAVRDDDGYFLGHGMTLFWAVWGWQHDRERLEAHLRWLAERGSVEYIRVLAVVGGRYWDDRAADPRVPGWDEAIAGVTDLAWSYGLRVEWTIFGEVEPGAPTPGDRRAVIDRLLAALRGREQAVMHVEVANEAWQTGFGGDAGLAELRDLTRDWQVRTAIPVAITSNHDSAALLCATYADGIADLATVHFDRSRGVEGLWRAVRQPWGYPGEIGGGCELPAAASSNEPIGPGTSVNSDTDPVRLVAQILVAHVSGLALSVLHTEAGVWGGGRGGGLPGAQVAPPNLWDYPELTEALRILRLVETALPRDLPNWDRQNAHWSGAPFEADHLWPDGGDHGAVRVYSAVRGDRYVTVVIGVRDRVTLRPRRALTARAWRLGAEDADQEQALSAGESLTLRGTDTAWLVIGRLQ